MSCDPWKKPFVEAIPRTALRPAEAAESLGISERKLADWMKEPAFPVARIGGVRLIPIEGLRIWLSKQINEQKGADV